MISETKPEDSSVGEALTKYLAAISDIDLLPPNVATQIFREYALTGKTDVDLRNIIVVHNLRLVVSVARRNGNRAVEQMDKVAFGNIGLITAAEKYDVDKINPDTGEPYRFTTYATWWIKQSIDREVQNTCATIRSPVHVHKKHYHICQAMSLLWRDGNVHPSDEEIFEMPICVKNGITLNEVNRIRYMVTSISEGGLAGKGDDEEEGGSFFDYVAGDISGGDPFENIAAEERLRVAESLLIGLSDKERYVMERRNGWGNVDGDTLENVGKEVGLTRERIRQIEVIAKKKLRAAFEYSYTNSETI